MPAVVVLVDKEPNVGADVLGAAEPMANGDEVAPSGGIGAGASATDGTAGLFAVPNANMAGELDVTVLWTVVAGFAVDTLGAPNEIVGCVAGVAAGLPKLNIAGTALVCALLVRLLDNVPAATLSVLAGVVDP